jgi:hypothetical protein
MDHSNFYILKPAPPNRYINSGTKRFLVTGTTFCQGNARIIANFLIPLALVSPNLRGICRDIVQLVVHPLFVGTVLIMPVMFKKASGRGSNLCGAVLLANSAVTSTIKFYQPKETVVYSLIGVIVLLFIDRYWDSLYASWMQCCRSGFQIFFHHGSGIQQRKEEGEKIN